MIDVCQIISSDNLSDLFTKSLPRKVFEQLLISRYFIYISTFIGTKTCAINGQNGCISWNICRMWYCCEFISILQELGGIEEESGIKKHPHDPCSTSHGPYKLPLDRLHDHMSNRVNTQAHGPCDTLHGPCQTVPESSF